MSVLLVSGVLDRFPKLKIVLGHMGEGIPYFLWRIDYTYAAFRPPEKRMSLTPTEMFKRNFAITTSGMNSHPVLKYVIEVLGIDNVMWAIDYPYQAAPGSVEFMNTAPVSDADRRKLFQGNAERIFHIAPA
jgi:predicted TIM-barrel fold metal-dependent hydrolase